MKYHVKDEKLAENGWTKIEWANSKMPVLESIRKRFEKEKPLKGIRIGACLHVTTETANLMRTLKAGGAEVSLCGSNPLSTQDDVASALVKFCNTPVFAIKGEDDKTYYNHIHSVLDTKPHITMDDGADLISTIHTQRKDLVDGVIGGTEETTTGVIRLRSMAEKGVLKYPIIAVNDSDTKHLFDNRYGTGQSTIDGILRATNILIAGSNFVVCGYGWCARGVSARARGMGARVIVTEVDPVKALEAVMDGYEVMPIKEAARIGEVFVTLTGDTGVITKEHFGRMKDGAIVCNSGHFDVEVDVKGLKSMARKVREVRPFVQEYSLNSPSYSPPKKGEKKRGGETSLGEKRIYLLAEGRLVNLSAAEGHPAAVMDMSFANQSLAVEHLVKHGKKLEAKVFRLPEKLDHEIARLKLKTMGIAIDRLTDEQKAYLASWEMGT